MGVAGITDKEYVALAVASTSNGGRDAATEHADVVPDSGADRGSDCRAILTADRAAYKQAVCANEHTDRVSDVAADSVSNVCSHGESDDEAHLLLVRSRRWRLLMHLRGRLRNNQVVSRQVCFVQLLVSLRQCQVGNQLSSQCSAFATADWAAQRTAGRTAFGPTSDSPTSQPSDQPTGQPSSQPSSQPTSYQVDNRQECQVANQVANLPVSHQGSQWPAQHTA